MEAKGRVTKSVRLPPYVEGQKRMRTIEASYSGCTRTIQEVGRKDAAEWSKPALVHQWRRSTNGTLVAGHITKGRAANWCPKFMARVCRGDVA